MVNFYADHHFVISDTHLTAGKPCQDYALSSVDTGAAFAIISDGCSTGGHTDVGSRIIALSNLNALREYWLRGNKSLSELISQEVSVHQRIKLSAIREILGLKNEDMYATSLYAYVISEGGIIHLQGDGVIVLQYQNGDIVASRFDWANNAPFYPAYAGQSLIDFIALQGKNLDGLQLKEEKWQRTNSEWQPITILCHNLRQGMQGITSVITKEMLDNRIAFIGIFSDGICQIEGKDWKDAITDLMSFKNTTGEFVKRRINSAVRQYKNEGKRLNDDLSMAVIRIEHKTKEVEPDGAITG